MTKMNCVRSSSDTLDIRFGNTLLTTYRFSKEAPVSYFHPVNTVAGTTLSLDFPSDHLWHHALFFNWKYINGLNFWEDDIPESQRGIMTTLGDLEVNKQDKMIFIRQHLSWHDFSQNELLKERRTTVVHEPDSSEGYLMEFDLKFTALTDVLFERTPPKEFPWGGYAGLAFRPIRSFVQAAILNSEGDRSVDDAHGKAARWCDFSGPIDGSKGERGGVTLFDHPNNPRYPTPFYVFNDGPLQFLHAAFLFDDSYEMSQGDDLQLRYGVYVHAKEIDSSQAEEVYKRFATD